MAKDYKRIPVSAEAKEAAAEAKQENETWDEYVQRCAENPPEVKEYADLESVMNQLSMANDPTTDIDVEGMMQEIKKAQELAEQARDNTEGIERRLG